MMRGRLLTRPGVRCVNWGLQAIAGIVLATLLLPWWAALLPGEFGSLEKIVPVVFWLRNAAVLTLLLGVFLTTAAPGESRVAPKAVAILALSAAASFWPVVVYLTDLPAIALRGPLGDPSALVILLQMLLFAGLLAALCGWIARSERGGMEGIGESSRPPTADAKADAIVDWEKLAVRAGNLRTAGAIYFAAIVGLTVVSSRLVPLRAISDPRMILLATAGFLCWGLVLLVRFARTVWAVDRAFRHSSRRVESLEQSRSGNAIPRDRLTATGIAAGLLALGGLAANQWASTTLAPAWTARHAREIGAAGLAGPAGGASVGQAAPPLEMTTIDGESIRLADLAGMVVVLNFWATRTPLSL